MLSSLQNKIASLFTPLPIETDNRPVPVTPAIPDEHTRCDGPLKDEQLKTRPSIDLSDKRSTSPNQEDRQKSRRSRRAEISALQALLDDPPSRPPHPMEYDTATERRQASQLWEMQKHEWERERELDRVVGSIDSGEDDERDEAVEDWNDLLRHYQELMSDRAEEVEQRHKAGSPVRDIAQTCE